MKNFLKKCLLISGIANIWISKTKSDISILNIHGVTKSKRDRENPNYEGRHVFKDDFRMLIKLVKKYYRPITIKCVENYYYKNEKLPNNPILLTFDDGFSNNYYHAYPILKEHDVPATIFLSTKYIENKETLWVELLEYVINKTEQKNVDINVLGEHLRLTLRDYEERKKAFLYILNRLKKNFKNDEINNFVRKFAQKYKSEWRKSILRNEDYRFLTWSQVKEMHDNGIAFGAHTVHHVNLVHENINRAKWEIEISKKEIENNINEECKAFSYPFGLSGYSSKIEELIVQAGFKLGFSIKPGLNSKNSNPLLLNRFPIGWYSAKKNILWDIIRS